MSGDWITVPTKYDTRVHVGLLVLLFGRERLGGCWRRSDDPSWLSKQGKSALRGTPHWMSA